MQNFGLGFPLKLKIELLILKFSFYYPRFELDTYGQSHLLFMLIHVTIKVPKHP